MRVPGENFIKTTGLTDDQINFSSPAHMVHSKYINQQEHLEEMSGLQSFGLLSFQLLLLFVCFSKGGLI